MPKAHQVKIREISLRHYRAFADARLRLSPITFLVGRNGAGKSTLMDAFAFMSEAITDSLGTALERRGNLEGIRQRQPGQGTRFDVSLAIGLEADGLPLVYGFRLGRGETKSSYAVKYESLSGFLFNGFERNRESFSTGSGIVTGAYPDPETLLFPVIGGSDPKWKAILDAIRNISVHQFSPQSIRSEPRIGSEERLNRDGGNAGDVLKRTGTADRSWIESHLHAAVPGVIGVKSTARAGRRVIVFEQEGGGQTYQFDASMMSDGTVRSLGILLALRQAPRPSIVLLDEIEDSLHPFARSVLLDAIESASEEFPVVVSTHDPEILSHPSATPDRVRVVEWAGGASQVYQLSDDIQANLKPPQSVGRLLRSNALWTQDLPSTTGAEADFFKVK